MAVTPTIQNVKPVVGGSADTWGGTLNDRITETYTDINALATQGNASETAIAGALLKTGGTMTGNIALADIAPTTGFDAGFRTVPVISIDADRTFLATDSGKCIRLFGVTARTWTMPANTLPVGAGIMIRNASGGLLTIARGGGVVIRIDGSAVDANRSLASFGRAVLFQEDTNQWIISGVGAS